MEKIYDLIIIGSGPAGLTAAIYAQRAKLETLVIEASYVSGGQVVNTYEVDNYPGLPGISGMDLGTTLRNHADRMGGAFVRERVKELYGLEYPAESAALVSLLHDVCKTGCYRQGSRNVKGPDGKWQAVPTFFYEDPLPYGHGEKSVYILSGFLRLTREEAMAIRWHMGFSGDEDKRLVGQALQQYPLAFALSVADMEATYFLEKEES